MSIQIINGQSWSQQGDFNTQQTTDITGWENVSSLPIAIRDASALSTTEKRAQFDVGTVNADVIVNSMYKTLGDAQPITSFFIAQPAE